jgi:hypothetical protein
MAALSLSRAPTGPSSPFPLSANFSSKSSNTGCRPRLGTNSLGRRSLGWSRLFCCLFLSILPQKFINIIFNVNFIVIIVVGCLWCLGRFCGSRLAQLGNTLFDVVQLSSSGGAGRRGASLTGAYSSSTPSRSAIIFMAWSFVKFST